MDLSQYWADPIRQAFEINNDPVFGDICSELGFARALELVLRLIPYGLLFSAVPCQSFSFMSSYTHGRNGACPWGHMFRPFVMRGTLCATRFALLAILAIARNCLWVLEQPSRSALEHLPPIRLLLHKDLNPRSVKWIQPQLLNCNKKQFETLSKHLLIVRTESL